MKCDICGYIIEKLGTCQRNVRYDKFNNIIGRGKICHQGCVEKRVLDHIRLADYIIQEYVEPNDNNCLNFQGAD